MEPEAGRQDAHRRVDVPAAPGATMSTFPAPHTAPHHVRARPGPAARRFGYVVGAAVNAVMLYLINRSPGWEAVPFLTDATTQVLALVNASMATGLVANLAYLKWDPAWLKALGDLVTTSVGVLSMVRVWQVWPLDFSDGSAWNVIARVLVGVGIVGGLIGAIASVARFFRALAVPPRPTD